MHKWLISTILVYFGAPIKHSKTGNQLNFNNILIGTLLAFIYSSAYLQIAP